MQIERLQIEEGFLDGLDVSFAPGLNVIIGGRGTGKTSIVELIRFCLDVPGSSAETQRASARLVQGVLGSGRVTVTLRSGNERVIVSRTLEHDQPEATSPYRKPLVFSQNEIESVGLHDAARLRLIDSFIEKPPALSTAPSNLLAQIRSLCVEMHELHSRIEDMKERLTLRAQIEQRLPALRAEEERLLSMNKEIKEKKERSDQLAQRTGRLQAVETYFEHSMHQMTRWHQAIDDARTAKIDLPDWNLSGSEPQPIQRARAKARSTEELLSRAATQAAEILEIIRSAASQQTAQRIKLSQSARQLRQEVDRLQHGAGAVMRESAVLREQRESLKATEAALSQARASSTRLVRSRSELLDRVEDLRNALFRERARVADDLNEKFRGKIRISVENASQTGAYETAIASSLKGSGLHYTNLAALIASNMSPRELVEAVEARDTAQLTEITGLSGSRAVRVIDELAKEPLDGILTADVDDNVFFRLLDGAEYKDMRSLSTGQRCTVVLSILLEHRDRTLLIDQPEDHLDNAFVASTLISSIDRRGKMGQTIATTHNPNIPVLGGASRVIHLDSDGRRGFLRHEGELDDSEIVMAITTVMEGGQEAFERRARFYRSHAAQ